MSRTLRTNQLTPETLRAESVQHDAEVAPPLPFGSVRQCRAHEDPHVLRLHVAPHGTGALGTSDDPVGELLELGCARLPSAVHDAPVQPRSAHVELRQAPDEVEERLAPIVGGERLLREGAHLLDVALDHRDHEVGLGREAAEHRPVADSRQPGDLVDARVGAGRGEYFRGRVEHALEISPRVGAQLGHQLANTGSSSVLASASIRVTSRFRRSARKTARLAATKTAAPPKAYCQPCTTSGNEFGSLVWPTATVVRMASPSAPPTCCDVLKSPDASPWSSFLRPVVATRVSGMKMAPIPREARIIPGRTSDAYDPLTGIRA